MNYEILSKINNATLHPYGKEYDATEAPQKEFGEVLRTNRLESSPPLPTPVPVPAGLPLEGLRMGDRGPKVERLQKVLKKWNKNLRVGSPGRFDNNTRKALSLYKAIYGTGTSGGQIDEKTAQYLQGMEDGTFWNDPPTKTPAQEMLYHASRKLGTPYVLGGDGHRTTDCGMLTKLAMQGAGVTPSVSRLADMQYMAARNNQNGLDLAGEPEAGDLIFYRVPTSQSRDAVDGVTHVTMYVGDGTMLAASSSRGEVTLQPLSDLEPYLAGYGRPGQGKMIAADL